MAFSVSDIRRSFSEEIEAATVVASGATHSRSSRTHPHGFVSMGYRGELRTGSENLLEELALRSRQNHPLLQ